jgi:NAD(P)H-hydrate epimerase
LRSILSSTIMAQADQYTISQLGIPGATLMERAAEACLQALLPRCQSHEALTVLCGPGNNGGDGFSLARQWHEAGRQVTVYFYGQPELLRGEAAHHWQLLLKAGVRIRILTPPWFEPESKTSWLVDALFGTGLTRPLSGAWAELVDAVNRSGLPILAVDLPSGLDASSGRLPGAHIRACVTVTFLAIKLAHAVTPACLACGELLVADIGIRLPPQLAPAAFLAEMTDFQRPCRPVEGHKGTFGTLHILGGSSGMEGAAFLAAQAALRLGAGKVRILCENPQSGRYPAGSIMTGSLALPQNFEQPQAMVIGPGLGRNPSTHALLDGYPLENLPIVWDADGLSYLASSGRQPRSSPWLLTPHPGEAAQLLACSAGEVQADRLQALEALSHRFPSCYLLLKGYRSLARTPAAARFVIASGNSALAKAGTGDVLAGMLGALLAAGVPAEDALVLAPLRHGFAAERWLESHPAGAMLAEDLLADLALSP